MKDDLAEEFKGKFECLGENTETYLTFPTTIQKCNEYEVLTTYIIKFINSVWHMVSSLWTTADILTEELYEDICEDC